MQVPSLQKPTNNLQKILGFLEKNPVDSSQSLFLEESHLKALYLLLKEISFFKNSFPQSEDLLNFIRHCSNHFHYELYPQGSIIFHKGDQADKFFLILKGEAGVFVPQNSDEIKSAKSVLLDQSPILSNFPNSKQRNTGITPFTLAPTPQIQPYFQSPLPKVPVEQKDPNTFEQFFVRSPEIKKKYFEDEFFVYKMIKILGPKDCFGELALSNNKPRSATIVAVEELAVLTLSKEDFERDFSKMIKETQQKFDFFHSLLETNQNETSSTLLMRVIYYFHEQFYGPNQLIFKENEEVKAFFIIVDGEIEIFQTKNTTNQMNFLTSGPVKTTRTILNIAKLGTFGLLGIEDILEEKNTRSYSAITLTQCKLYIISKKSFALMTKNVPQMLLMFKSLSLAKSEWRKQRIKEVSQATQTANDFFQKNLKYKFLQNYVPWTSKTKGKGKVIRNEYSPETNKKTNISKTNNNSFNNKTNDNIITNNKNDNHGETLEDVRLPTYEVEEYVDKKVQLFEKLNKIPFDLKNKRSIFYFPQEKLKENLRKMNKTYNNNETLNPLDRRYSADNYKYQMNLKERSNSKSNNTNNNFSNSVFENKSTMINNQLLQSKRYVNVMRPSTNHKIKEMVIKKLNNNSNQEIMHNNGILFYEDPYKIKENFTKQHRQKKVWTEFKKIIKKSNI